MKQIEVSHEVPLCLLEWSVSNMDFQYALPHLLEKNEEYRNHFLKCKEKGIKIYLDNSVHELGDSVNNDILMKWINELEPNYVFVPDVLEDATLSVRNARYWSNFKFEKTEKIAVVQAKKLSEAIYCIQTYKDLGYKKIAIPYGSTYYCDYFKHPNKDYSRGMGRVIVINELHQCGVLSKFDWVHILGISVPQEMVWFKDYECIKSIDTSNPIMAALDKTTYSTYGLDAKPKACLNDNFSTSIEYIDLDIVDYNTNQFKKWIKRQNS